MKLTWQPIDNEGDTDGNPVVLADHEPRRGPGSKVVLTSGFNHQNEIEGVSYVRATSAEFFDRDNQSTTFSAQVHYEFGSVSECSQFMARLGLTMVSGRGNLRIDHDGGGFDTVPRAVWQAIQVGPKLGVVVTVAFSFTGGQVNGA